MLPVYVVLDVPDRQRGFKKERILRVLLQQPDEGVSRYRVAKEAGASEPWVHEYLDRLEGQGLIRGTEIQDIAGVVREWPTVRISPTRLQVSFQHPLQVLERAGLQYALTTYQAEQRVGGQLFTKTTDFYIHPDERDQWERIVEENGLLGGGNTTVLVTDPHVFYNNRQIDGLTMVSAPQLILDLLSEGGPAVEAATMLAEEQYGRRITFTTEEG
jgi:predicted transcriptional regulator